MICYTSIKGAIFSFCCSRFVSLYEYYDGQNCCYHLFTAYCKLLLCQCYWLYQKRYANGLDLLASTVFEPIYGLVTTVDVTKYCSVLVHYQITLQTENAELFTMLTMNNRSVGSVVHSGRQAYKTATGFYMANFEPGKYKFQVHYKSPVPIYTSYDWDWETGILQAM